MASRRYSGHFDPTGSGGGSGKNAGTSCQFHRSSTKSNERLMRKDTCGFQAHLLALIGQGNNSLVTIKRINVNERDMESHGAVVLVPNWISTIKLYGIHTVIH